MAARDPDSSQSRLGEGEFPELKKNAFSSGGVVRGAAKFRVFQMPDKHDRRYVSDHVACGFTLGGTSEPGPPLAARNSKQTVCTEQR